MQITPRAQTCEACQELYTQTQDDDFQICPECAKLWNDLSAVGIHAGQKAFMVKWREVYVPLTRLFKRDVLSHQEVQTILAVYVPHLDARYRQQGKGHSFDWRDWPGYREAIDEAAVR